MIMHRDIWVNLVVGLPSPLEGLLATVPACFWRWGMIGVELLVFEGHRKQATCMFVTT